MRPYSLDWRVGVAGSLPRSGQLEAASVEHRGQRLPGAAPQPILCTTRARILIETGLSPRSLELEVTETALVRDLNRALALPIHDDLRFGAYAAFGTSGRTGSFGFFTA